jgi:hypothetical protein
MWRLVFLFIDQGKDLWYKRERGREEGGLEATSYFLSYRQALWAFVVL